MTADFGLLGKKIGMTQVFNPDGALVGVTAVEVGPCVVVQKKTEETDGYTAVQLGFDDKPERKTNHPMAGKFKKVDIAPKRHLQEFRISSEVAGKLEVGQVLNADVFSVGDKIDVSGLSKGKGFTGVMKRYGYHGAKATHGVHECFRHGGSLGQNMTPGRVMKGKKMAGHHGNKRITIQNLEVMRVFTEDNIIFIRGPIPGGHKTLLTIRPAVKKTAK